MTTTMKAAVRTAYGPPDVLSIQDVPKPVPGPGALLVRVTAATVNRTDCAILAGDPVVMRLLTGLLRPKLASTGTDFAGVVEAVGEGVQRFKVGDRVMGFDDLGLQSHAEYLVMGEDKGVTATPAAWSDAQAAAASEGAHYAVNFLNKVTLQAGQDVLIHGASGAIGSALVQLCRAKGATITAVCTAKTLDLVRSLGAAQAMDHQAQDFTQGSGQYHFIFDAVGKSSFFKCRHLLRPGGIYISSEPGAWGQNLFLPLATPLLGGKKVVFPVPSNIPATLETVCALAAQGLFTAVVDRSHPLSQIQDAYRYVASGQKVGNVIITMDGQAAG